MTFSCTLESDFVKRILKALPGDTVKVFAVSDEELIFQSRDDIVFAQVNMVVDDFAGQFGDSFCLPMGDLRSLIEVSGDRPQLSYETGAQTVRLTNGSDTMRISTLDDSVIEMSSENYAEWKTLLKDDLATMNRASSYASPTDANIIFTGVCVRNGYVMATDRYKVFRSPVEIGDSILLPSSSQRVIFDVFSLAGLESGEYSFDGSHFFVRCGNAYVGVSAIGDGSNYTDLNFIFHEEGAHLRFDHLAVVNALKACNVYSNNVDIDIEEGGRSMWLSSRSDIGSAEREIVLQDALPFAYEKRVSAQLALDNTFRGGFSWRIGADKGQIIINQDKNDDQIAILLNGGR